MEFQKYFPTIGDFNNQVTTFHFTQGDLDFQKKMAIKAGYKSWEDYLNFLFYLYANIYDIEALSNELGNNFSKTNMITGSLPILLNKHLNSSLKEEMQPIFDEVAKFPIEDQNRIEIFENKLASLFSSLMLNKRKNDPVALELVDAFQTDIKSQFLAINSSPNLENTSSIAESILMPNINSVIQKYTTQNFYFPDKTHLLKKLHDTLLKKGLVKQNDDFEKSFEKEMPDADTTCTEWTSNKIRELFYLLYFLGDKKQFPNGISIATIAYRLFKIENNPTENSLQSNLNEIIKRFDDEGYVSKNLKNIVAVISELQL